MTKLSNIVVLMSYLSGIYLKSRFSCLEGGVQKTLKKRRDAAEKTWKMNRKKNEEYRENQITTILTFDFTIYIKKYTLLENTVSKK